MNKIYVHKMKGRQACRRRRNDWHFPFSSLPSQFYNFHLNTRKKIVSVFHRRKQDEVNVLEDTIRQRSEQQKKAGIELEATCHICLKTKFADGVGHMCHYCNIRCCARCGGKTTIRGKVKKMRTNRNWHSVYTWSWYWNCVVVYCFHSGHLGVYVMP